MVGGSVSDAQEKDTTAPKNFRRPFGTPAQMSDCMIIMFLPSRSCLRKQHTFKFFLRYDYQVMNGRYQCQSLLIFCGFCCAADDKPATYMIQLEFVFSVQVSGIWLQDVPIILPQTQNLVKSAKYAMALMYPPLARCSLMIAGEKNLSKPPKDSDNLMDSGVYLGSPLWLKPCGASSTSRLSAIRSRWKIFPKMTF
ncbi:hypothetical protein BDP27DRAFT_856570 [Rhodocollybia butyracea]|uniref:Uncharacterized protein n=1 Tax=Rhodocollybia butyracea TaxID=206335 RepID=A0A9P5PRN9_9AGAR|nr:hypothetical protein BDP27DRAFT_856570 [Rhodocollybia butyracea]